VVVSIQGTVDKIWHNHRTDGSEYWVLAIDGQRYSTWDKSMIANILEGDSVEFAFTDSGRYLSLTALKRTGDSIFTTVDKLRISPESLCTVRMSCLSTAAEMLKDTTLLPEQKVALALNMAKKMENHILGPQGLSEYRQPAEQADNVEAETESRKEGKA